MIRFEVGQAYAWTDDDGVTLIDAGPVGAGDEVRTALRSIGVDADAVQRIVLTHGHGDHAGSLAEIQTWSDATVVAHHREAPYVQGEETIPDPVLVEWERPLFAQVGGHLSPPPAKVHQQVKDGDILPFGGGARVIAVPGHTAGSIALHLPDEGVLFTGDTVASYEGEVILGVFNRDRTETIASLAKLAQLDTDIVAFGHGDPVDSAGGSRLQTLAASLA
jgi:glyoxylase-like metal-dependent hydrolase (beta-lactamase superfamily II)